MEPDTSSTFSRRAFLQRTLGVVATAALPAWFTEEAVAAETARIAATAPYQTLLRQSLRVGTLFMMGRNPGYAQRWQDGLEQAAVSLETFPRRCPLAHENDSFPYEVRQLLYASHRILFTLIDADADGEDDTVRILHVRHQAQRWLDDDAE